MSIRPLEPNYTYLGEDLYQPPDEGETDALGREYYPYIPSSDLKEAVNLAIKLQRPLLLEGEPGCGKTRLAGAVAYEFTQKYFKGQVDAEGKPLWWNYYSWNVKSTSRARDGLYTYDAVLRLRDAQFMGSDLEQLQQYLGETQIEALKKRLQDQDLYRKFGALGYALKQTEYRPILLIDEIDKADSDFPNDLLLELDELRFEIPETGETIPAPEQKAVKPIIIMTSNRERPLPEPFLRRCLYFYVGFPEEAQLLEIINRRFGSLKRSQQELVQEMIDHFYEVRELLENQPGIRAPGTSEILELLKVLLDQKKPIKEAREDLRNLAKRLPLLGILLKTRSAQEIYRENFLGQGDG